LIPGIDEIDILADGEFSSHNSANSDFWGAEEGGHDGQSSFDQDWDGDATSF
jgi:hypothetical protein